MLLLGLALTYSISSFASVCKPINVVDDQLRFESLCYEGEITFESIRIKHKAKYIKLGPVQGAPAKLFCQKLGLDYVRYEVKEYLFPRTFAIVHEMKDGKLIVDTVAKKHFEYAAYNGIDEVVCK